MIKLVSDNCVQRMSFTRVGLTAEENEAMFLGHKDQFYATAQYKICVDHEEDLDPGICPSSIKFYLDGPFVLSIHNIGDQIQMLCSLLRSGQYHSPPP